MKSTQRYKELIHIKIALWISIGQQLSDDCIFAVDSCAIETTAGLQMCWDLLGSRLRSLAKSAPDNHQRRGKKCRAGPEFLCDSGAGGLTQWTERERVGMVSFSYNAGGLVFACKKLVGE